MSNKISSSINEYLESVAATDSAYFSDEDYSYQKRYERNLNPWDWDWDFEETESEGRCSSI